MKATRLTLTVLVLFICATGTSQEFQLTKQDTIVKSSWIFGVGFNVVDDAGSEFSNFFNVEDNWNAVPYPSRLSIGRYFENGLGIEAIGAYNQYQEGNTVDDVILTEDIDYFSIDLRLSYDLNKILGQTGFFDPYVGLGVGYTDANNVGRGTYNAVIGFRTWFSDKIGLDFNSTGKWAMSTDNATNHIQHAVGLVYQFGAKKGLSTKGEEKLALLQELEKEQQRVQDSITSSELKAKEARELAARIAKEKKETERIAAETTKLNEEKAKKLDLENKIKALGNVYFNLNSSYLQKEGKAVLENFAAILKANPNAVITVSSHTDSRGSVEYNQWLSERRLKRTVDYLSSIGISNDRLLIEPSGENKLANGCVDGVKCTEEEHQENRRCEFRLAK